MNPCPSCAQRFRSTRGSALLASILLTLVVAAIAGLYLESVRQEIINTHRTRLMLETVNLAETGAEDAINALLTDAWNGWTEGSHGYSRQTTVPGGMAGEQRVVRTFIDLGSTNSPKLVTEAEITHPSGVTATRQIRIDLDRRGLFANGITSRNGVVFNGNRVDVDSYNSGDGPYHPTDNRRDGGSVASSAVTVDSVNIQNANVWGYVATGGAPPRVGNNGSIMGGDTPSGVNVDPNRVTTDFYAEFTPISAPTLSNPFTNIFLNNMGIPFASTEYTLNSLSISSNASLNVNGDVTLVVKGDIDIKGELVLSPGATITIYAEGDIAIGGNGIVNPSGIPARTVLFATGAPDSGQEIKLHGNGAFIGALYAPFADVSLRGGGNSGELLGAVVGQTVTISGTYAFHYDEALATYGNNGKFSLVGWRDLESRASRYPDVLALRHTGLPD